MAAIGAARNDHGGCHRWAPCRTPLPMRSPLRQKAPRACRRGGTEREPRVTDSGSSRWTTIHWTQLNGIAGIANDRSDAPLERSNGRFQRLRSFNRQN